MDERGEGTVLEGRYEIGARIGAGGHGVVHRAWDRVRGRAVAVKLLAPGTAAVGPRPGRSEADLLAALDHPNLVALHDVLATASGPALVMELVDGPSLQERLAAGPLPLEDAATVLRDIAAGLAHAHRRGVVHRDVKPGNVLLRLVGERVVEAKLADFGIARRADATRTTAERTVVGTVGFVSPEQLRGDRVGAAADVYALGLAVLTAVTGEHPFPGPDAASLAARLVRAPRVPEGLPVGWAALLAAMTALDPATRPDAAAVASAADALPAAPHGSGAAAAALARSRPGRAARAVTLGGTVAVLGAALGAALAFALAPAAVEDVLAGGAPPSVVQPAPTTAATAPAAAEASAEARATAADEPAAATAPRTAGDAASRAEPGDDHGGRGRHGGEDRGGHGSAGGDDRGGHGSGGRGSDD